MLVDTGAASMFVKTGANNGLRLAFDQLLGHLKNDMSCERWTQMPSVTLTFYGDHSER